MASECILVDDTEENVIAAEKLGMNGIVFKTYKELMWEISNTTGVTVI
jgi:FMN phosphatase YigB (HAD superfamily)